MTPARINAPQGARLLADILAAEDFADMAVINLDWEGDGFTPVLVIDTIKWFPQYDGRRLESSWRLDMDDAFGADNFDGGVARQMVHDLRELFLERSALGPPDRR
jgi:hypothetical protein